VQLQALTDSGLARCFLAIKHASEAMKAVQDGSGKTQSGGSILLTASGE
jgi:hypothetical protein